MNRPGLLIHRSHQVSLYVPVDSGAAEDAWGHPTTGVFTTPVATLVECNLQPLGGDVEQSAAGRAVDADWQADFPESVLLRPDMGLLVTAVRSGDAWVAVPASHPTTFRVRFAGWKGDGWDTEVLLRSTPEAIPS